jgi:hypothetical protein
VPSRTLREGLVASDKVAAMEPGPQDRFPRYFLLADDYGCFRVQAEVIKGDIYPRRPDITPKIVADDLVEFERVGCLMTWNTDGGHTYGFFIGWWEHNRKPRPTSRRKTPRPPHPKAEPPADSRHSEAPAEPELSFGSRSLPDGALRQASAPAVRSTQFAHAEKPPVAPRQEPGGQPGTVLRLPKIRKRPRRKLSYAEQQVAEVDELRDERAKALGTQLKVAPMARDEQLRWVQVRCHASPEEAADVVAIVETVQAQSRRAPS